MWNLTVTWGFPFVPARLIWLDWSIIKTSLASECKFTIVTQQWFELRTLQRLLPFPSYVSFICGFIFDEMILESQIVCSNKSIWLSAHNPESISSEKTIRIMNHLIKFICKHCRNLTLLGLSLSMKYSNVINLSQFISSISLQNKLQHIILSEGNFGWDSPYLTDYSDAFNLLLMQI